MHLLQHPLYSANSNGLDFGFMSKDSVPPAARLPCVKTGHKTGNAINPVYLETNDSPFIPQIISLPLCTYHFSNQEVEIYPFSLNWAEPLTAFWYSGILSLSIMKAWQFMLLPYCDVTAKKLHG